MLELVCEAAQLEGLRMPIGGVGHSCDRRAIGPSGDNRQFRASSRHLYEALASASGND
jgi:hypothetical protein